MKKSTLCLHDKVANPIRSLIAKGNTDLVKKQNHRIPCLQGDFFFLICQVETSSVEEIKSEHGKQMVV